jgi:hypothetical protein
MVTRFKGAFTPSERQRITRSARAIEHLRDASGEESCWVILHFQTPHGGYRYWGIRLSGGYTVHAHTAMGLSVALEGVRDQMV